MKLVSQVTKHFVVFVTMGLIFLLLGIYAFYLLFFDGVSEPELWVAGGGCLLFGVTTLWKMLKPLQSRVSENKLRICPFCGAVLEENAIFCIKCNSKLAE